MYIDQDENLADERREEIAAAHGQYLREWLALGNHCHHCPAGRICDACRADYAEDSDAWIEFGTHAQGCANWSDAFQRPDAQKNR